jgi:DDE superfamily endonuclease
MEITYTYAKRGSRLVPMQAAPLSGRATAMLVVSLSGNKLPPFLVYKGLEKNATGTNYRELFHKEGYPSGVELSVQAKAWMDERQMIKWIVMVWKPFAVREKNLYLIMDECPSHLLMSNVCKAFADCRTEVDYIPGGYTSRLQVLDVGINIPLSDSTLEKIV